MIADAGVAGNHVKLQRLERRLRSASLGNRNGGCWPALPVGTCKRPYLFNRFPPLTNGRFQQAPFGVAEIAEHQIPHTRAGACKRDEATIRNVSGPGSRPAKLAGSRRR
jgi:hypothetical protein